MLSVVGEVIGPCVTPGMKQRHDTGSLRINSSQIGALTQVAVRASQSEVITVIASAVLSWNDVLDVKAQLGELLR